MTVRVATEADYAALCRLARRAPMAGSVRYCLERDPDFFALTRLQGTAAEVLAIDAPGGGEIAAMGTHAPLVRTVGTEPRRISYLGDLKIDPHHRGKRFAGELLDAARGRLEATGADFGIALVLGGNRSMSRIVESRTSALRFERAATIRNYSVYFAHRGCRVSGMRRATESDIPEMVALSNRTGAVSDLACVWSENSLRARMRAMGLAIDDFHVIERRGRMTAFGAVWDASAIKRVRLLGLGPSLALARQVHRIGARMAGVAPMPRDGDLVPFGYVTLFAAECAEDLRGLLVSLLRERERHAHLYLDLALDVRHPLSAALGGLVTTHVDFDLYTVRSAAAVPLRVGPRPLSFDMALV